MDDGQARIPAARWVIGLGRCWWGLLVLGAAWSLLGALFSWSAVALAVPVLFAGHAAAWGALLAAFTAHRRGAWQLLVGLAVAGVAWPGAGWVATGRPAVVGLLGAVVSAGLLGLLLHRDSREWVGAGGRPAAGRAAPRSAGG